MANELFPLEECNERGHPRRNVISRGEHRGNPKNHRSLNVTPENSHLDISNDLSRAGLKLRSQSRGYSSPARMPNGKLIPRTPDHLKTE